MKLKAKKENLEYSDTLYIIASDGASKRKVIQVALKTPFKLRKDKPEKNDFVIYVSSIAELTRTEFKAWLKLKII